MPKRYTPNDKWSQRAASEGYRARSVYKLMELHDRFRLLKPGMTVLDCGAAPGSWLQFASEIVGVKGRVIGIDRQAIEPVAENVITMEADITDVETVGKELQKLGLETVDIVLSDLAPNTSGIRDVDQWKSIELSEAVIALAETFLKPGGTCVLKVLRGADFDEFLREKKRQWKNVKIAHAHASRDRSTEVYMLLQGHKPA